MLLFNFEKSKKREKEVGILVSPLPVTLSLPELWQLTKSLVPNSQRLPTIEKIIIWRLFFCSGVIGSGLCIFSKHQILDTFLYQYSVNGYPYMVSNMLRKESKAHLFLLVNSLFQFCPCVLYVLYSFTVPAWRLVRWQICGSHSAKDPGHYFQRLCDSCEHFYLFYFAAV